MSKIITIGLDLAKNVFKVPGADGTGRTVLGNHQSGAAKLSPGQLKQLMPACVSLVFEERLCRVVWYGGFPRGSSRSTGFRTRG